jgi:hypothetical protein
MTAANFFASSIENKLVVAVQHVRYRGAIFPKGGAMEPNVGHPEYRSLEERIRHARAERSVYVGYAIGEALEALWRVIGSLPFAPSASRPRAQPRRSLLARFSMHR